MRHFGRKEVDSRAPRGDFLRKEAAMFRIAPLVLVFAALSLPLSAEERRAGPLAESESWDLIAPDVIGVATPQDATGLYTLEAPFRAHDAATVPIRFVQQEGAPDIRRLTLIVDENPSPVVAEFTFGPGMGPIDLETRVRVDAYSNVRAIAEAEDGRLYMTGGFVRASGGCSAPASKDAAEALAAMGEMRARFFEAEPLQAGIRREAQVMLRHPNYSGLQRDQITHLFVPAHFVDSLEVRQGEELLFAMTGGISISEDPSFRFRYTDTGAGPLGVRATDTEGDVFEGEFAAGS
jgi:sulfur-oxidizing protein SoxY